MPTPRGSSIRKAAGNLRSSGVPKLPTNMAGNLITRLLAMNPAATTICPENPPPAPHQQPPPNNPAPSADPPDALCPCGDKGPQSLNLLCKRAAQAFPTVDWRWLRCLAQIESSSCANPDAFDLTKRHTSYGIFQINASAWGQSPAKLVTDCTFNADFAAKILAANLADPHLGRTLQGAVMGYFDYADTRAGRLNNVPSGNVLSPNDYWAKFQSAAENWGIPLP